MRQAGYLAAAGIYALKNNVERLKQDHDHARQMAEALRKKDFVTEILPVETNIIIFEVKEPWTAPRFVDKLKEFEILGHPISPTQVRLVTHLDVTTAMVEKTIEVITKL
jgi:threonine aldolase